jgi:hypothetical protein
MRGNFMFGIIIPVVSFPEAKERLPEEACPVSETISLSSGSVRPEQPAERRN